MQTSAGDSKPQLPNPDREKESMPALSSLAPDSSPTATKERSTDSSASENDSSSGSDISAWQESNPVSSGDETEEEDGTYPTFSPTYLRLTADPRSPEQGFFSGPLRRVASRAPIPSPSPGIDGAVEHQLLGSIQRRKIVTHQAQKPLGLRHRPARSSGLASELSQVDSDLEENGQLAKSKRFPSLDVTKAGQKAAGTGDAETKTKSSRAVRYSREGETGFAVPAGEKDAQRW